MITWLFWKYAVSHRWQHKVIWESVYINLMIDGLVFIVFASRLGIF